MLDYTAHKLLVANRGEIAVRILRTANRLGLTTVAVYTPSDALSPHVSLADEAIALSPDPTTTHDHETPSEASLYLSPTILASLCRTHAITLLHPGYGFLSESSAFAQATIDAGATWLGPRPAIIAAMGLKHKARELATEAELRVVPGSAGIVESEDEAVGAARGIGYPVILKATAGGGGMGMVVCWSEDEVRKRFTEAGERAKTLFGEQGVLIEKYFQSARHIEVQIFGDGQGNVVHMGERECSMQRRHQKVIEETPSPFFRTHPELRGAMCEAAVNIGRLLNYNSAGTVEFIVDEPTGEFYFLEMNTRIQVEHPITEATHPGLDIVEMMIDQGIAERQAALSCAHDINSTTTKNLTQPMFTRDPSIHAIEARIYAENPFRNFQPCPGLLQQVKFGGQDWLRVDTWISTGTIITPHFDPLLCKLIVTGDSRDQALSRLVIALNECKISGPPNNIEFLQAVLASDMFKRGETTTRALEEFEFVPRAMTITAPGIDTSIQHLPGRLVGLGIPRSGPADPLAFQIANIIVGNGPETEALETVVVPGVALVVQFHVEGVVAVGGREVDVSVLRVDGVRAHGMEESGMWRRLVVPAGGRLEVRGKPPGKGGPGMRVYVAVRGGFPGIPEYLGSKSTSMGLGGYLGRTLLAGDQIALGINCGRDDSENNFENANINHNHNITLSASLTPHYTSSWTIRVLSGPHDDNEFVTPTGREAFYAAKWRVGAASNRMGIRLEGQLESSIQGSEKVQGRVQGTATKIQWARKSGGEGGSHPSNILDNAYAPGSVNVNGDTPVILGREGPDMGGYVCLCVVASGEMWKLGQLSPGDTIQFQRISWTDSLRLMRHTDAWVDEVQAAVTGRAGGGDLSKTHNDADTSPAGADTSPTGAGTSPTGAGPGPAATAWTRDLDLDLDVDPSVSDAKLRVVTIKMDDEDVDVTFRQAGDSAILVEFGPMALDFKVRALVHAFEQAVAGEDGDAPRVDGVVRMSPCIRSTMCHYDPLTSTLPQPTLLSVLSHRLITMIPGSGSTTEMSFAGRVVRIPIVLDDRWSRGAVERYMRTSRDRAVYLPSNIEYLGRNNGVGDGGKDAGKDEGGDAGKDEVLRRLVESDWMVFGIGFYLACPFMVPIDPRCRLVGQKMNPSRTYTPRGAIGIAGVVAAIYPVESPGGYQLFGRTLPAWHTWGRGDGESSGEGRPWLLRVFDQVHFDVVSEEEYEKLEMDFDAGRYKFEIKPSVFSMAEHEAFVSSISHEVAEFRKRQAVAVAEQEAIENGLLAEWEASRDGTHETGTNESGSEGGTASIVSPVFASVWKVKCKPGDVIPADDSDVVVLEAMKTEIGVKADSGLVGRRVVGCVREGVAVKPGDVLLVVE
ncbi:hypothetical protein HGRIS_010533 [Hohenbuehelia grisea]|uniref:Urea carboxylase n=1 Tax=Hohenbuehelia grisea TaxID=104357 RepID=A0ABR3IX94_9AGAR